MKKNRLLVYLLLFGGLFFFAPSAFALTCDGNMTKVLGVIKSIIGVILFVVPVVIIGFAVVDVFKVVTNGKDAEGERKKAFTTLAIRFLLGIMIFFIPEIVGIIFNGVLPDSEATSAINCYNNSKGCSGSQKLNETNGKCEDKKVTP